jgi:hypothetical protein
MKVKSIDDGLEIRTIQEHNEYVKKLDEQSKGVVRLSILITSTEADRIKLNILSQELYRQIETSGYNGKGTEEWKVKALRINEDKTPVLSEKGDQVYDLAMCRYKHKDQVEFIYDESNEDLDIRFSNMGKKAKGSYFIRLDVNDKINKTLVKDLMKGIEEGIYQPGLIGI